MLMGIEVILQIVRVNNVIRSAIIILIWNNYGRVHRKSKNIK